MKKNRSSLNQAQKIVEYPVVLSSLHGRVKIYRSTKGSVHRYTVSWVHPIDGRQRKGFSSEADATHFAHDTLNGFERGFVASLKIHPLKVALYAEYEKILKEHGVTIREVVGQFLLRSGGIVPKSQVPDK